MPGAPQVHFEIIPPAAECSAHNLFHVTNYPHLGLIGISSLEWMQDSSHSKLMTSQLLLTAALQCIPVQQFLSGVAKMLSCSLFMVTFLIPSPKFSNLTPVGCKEIVCINVKLGYGSCQNICWLHSCYPTAIEQSDVSHSCNEREGRNMVSNFTCWLRSNHMGHRVMEVHDSGSTSVLYLCLQIFFLTICSSITNICTTSAVKRHIS